MDNELFEDLIASCKEVIDYKKGNIQLKTTTIEIPDEEVERSQLLWQKIENLSEQKKHRAMLYIDELLGA
jgi:hypothetical protein